MAGDWIKMRGNLWDDPRVAALVDATDTSEAMVIGGLYWLWATADQHTEDGVMPGLTLRQIDRKTSIPGFGAALVAVGWLAEEEAGVKLSNFTEHNGASAKLRSTDAKRKAVSRADDSSKAEKRKTFTPQQKYRIFAMDGFKCVYCGRHKDDPVPANLDPSGYVLSIDHLTPFCQGGDNSDDNLVTACLPCNMAKNGRTPEEAHLVPNLSERIRTTHGQVAPNLGAREREEKEIEKEEKKPRAPRSPAPTLVGVPPELLADYMAVRKAKKAGPLTDTAVAALEREASKAGLTLCQAITACVEFSWQGFNAGWYAERTAGKPSPSVTVPGFQGRDPALQKLEDDAKRAVPPSLETLARMAELRRAGAH